MILKIQKSIFTDCDYVQYLIYNQEKTVNFQTDEDTYAYLFKDKDFKIYIERKDNGEMKRINDQDW